MSLRAAYRTAFTAAMVVYLAMVFWTLPGISTAAGGLAEFDLRPMGYRPDEARAFIGALSDQGRVLYLGPQRLLDFFYPGLLAIVLGGAIWSLVRPVLLRRVLLAMVVGGMLADYVKNSLVKGLLKSPGPVTDLAILTASRATVIKTALTGLAMIAVLIAAVLTLVQRRKAR